MSAPVKKCEVAPLEALRRLYEVARKVDASESGEFETLLQGELVVAESVLRDASMVLPGCLADRLYEAIGIARKHALHASSVERRKKWDATHIDLQAALAVHSANVAAAPVVPVAAQPVVQQEPITLPFPIETEEMIAFRRFYECALDGEGHDVPASMMKSLAGIGLVQRRHASYYETTDFGLAVLDGKFAAPSLEAPPAGEVEEQLRGEGWLAAMDKITALLPGTYYMDPPDGGSVSVLEQVERMAKDAARYRYLRDAKDDLSIELLIKIEEGGAVMDAAIDYAMAQGDKA